MTEKTMPIEDYEFDRRRFRSFAAFLEDLTRRLLAELQTPDFKNSSLLLKYMHKDFTVVRNSEDDCPFPANTGLESHYEDVEKVFKEDQALAFTPFNMTAHVHRGSKSAEVFFMVRAKETRHVKAFGREGACIFYFEREPDNGRWIAHRVQTLRGGGSFVGW